MPAPSAPSSEPRPLALSDSEISHIMSACRPLSSVDREVFLRQVASVLGREPVLGDGVVSRVCREVFKQHWSPPELSRNNGSKYR